jgi:hypothetical protein
MQRSVFVFRLISWSVAGFVLGFALSGSVFASKPPQLVIAQAAIDPQTMSSRHQFESDAGLMLKFVRPDRVGDFEAIVAKLNEAQERSSSPERRRQAQSWRVFRAAEPATNGDVVYVFEMDPAVKGADYTVARILAEAFPTEAQSLYRRYADASSTRQHVVDLTLIAAFGR